MAATTKLEYLAKLDKEMEKFARTPKPKQTPVFDKECKKCGTVKPSTEFHKSKQNKDGRHSWCKQCMKDYYNKTEGNERKQAKTEREVVYKAMTEEVNKMCKNMRQYDAYLQQNCDKMTSNAFLKEVEKVQNYICHVQRMLLRYGMQIEAKRIKVKPPQDLLSDMTWVQYYIESINKTIYNKTKRLLK